MTRKYLYSVLMFVAMSCHGIHAQSTYDATRMCALLLGDGSTEMEMLGRNKKGNQLWYTVVKVKKTNDFSVYYYGCGARLYWCCDFEKSGHYGLDENTGENQSNAHDVLGENVMHFVLPVSERHALYAGYHIDKGTWGYKTPNGDFTLYPQTTLTASTPVFDADNAKYKQTLKWNIENVVDKVLSKAMILASYDSGRSWITLGTIPDIKACDSLSFNIPWEFPQIRYRIIAIPKDDFKMLFDDDSGFTSNQTEDFNFEKINIPCEFSIYGTKTNFCDAEKLYNRRYKPTVEWKVPDSYASALGSAELQYCLYEDDNDWQTILKIDQASGSQKVEIPVGTTAYRYRMIIKPKNTLSQMCDSTITDAIGRYVNYNPVYKSVQLNGTLSDCYDEKAETLTPTLAYELSDDLYETRLGNASISYSTDGGTTWTLATTISDFKQTGEVQITIPATIGEHLFRMSMTSSVNSVITPSIAQTTQAYTFTPPIELDDSKEYEAQSMTAGKVKVTRSFVNGRMGTVCLPFDLTEEQIAEGFGANANVYEYTSLSDNTMNFSKVTEMKAGKAYLVKTAEDKEKLSFSNVNISEDATPQQSEVAVSYVFTGTFSPYSMATDGSELFLSTSGNLKYPSSSDNNANRIRGYRGFFRVSGGNINNAKICIDGAVTSINTIDADECQPMKVYNLNGQYVGDSLNHLPKGVYVSDGKKVVVK